MIMSQNPTVVLDALSKAQQEFPGIPKRGYNPHFKSHFSTLADVKHAVEPVLRKYGLSVVQLNDNIGPDGRPALTTLIYHENEYIGSTTPLSLAKNDPQAHGSATSYMRRYAYTTALGLLAEDDDDAEIATHTPVDPVAELKDKIKAAAIEAGVKGKDVAEKFAQANPGQSYSTSKDVEAFKLLLEHLEGK